MFRSASRSSHVDDVFVIVHPRPFYWEEDYRLIEPPLLSGPVAKQTQGGHRSERSPPCSADPGRKPDGSLHGPHESITTLPAVHHVRLATLIPVVAER